MKCADLKCLKVCRRTKSRRRDKEKDWSQFRDKQMHSQCHSRFRGSARVLFAFCEWLALSWHPFGKQLRGGCVCVCVGRYWHSISAILTRKNETAKRRAKWRDCPLPKASRLAREMNATRDFISSVSLLSKVKGLPVFILCAARKSQIYSQVSDSVAFSTKRAYFEARQL